MEELLIMLIGNRSLEAGGSTSELLLGSGIRMCWSSRSGLGGWFRRLGKALLLGLKLRSVELLLRLLR